MGIAFDGLRWEAAECFGHERSGAAVLDKRMDHEDRFATSGCCGGSDPNGMHEHGQDLPERI